MSVSSPVKPRRRRVSTACMAACPLPAITTRWYIRPKNSPTVTAPRRSALGPRTRHNGAAGGESALQHGRQAADFAAIRRHGTETAKFTAPEVRKTECPLMKLVTAIIKPFKLDDVRAA